MSQRQVKWATKALQDLRALLGNSCARCGGTRDLEFDCIKPQGDKHHKIGLTHRASFYRKQYRDGNLQLLCRYPCHHDKSRGEQYWQETLFLQSLPANQPF